MVGKLIFAGLFTAALSSGKRRRKRRDGEDGIESQFSDFILGLAGQEGFGEEEGEGEPRQIGERRRRCIIIGHWETERGKNGLVF